MNSLFNKIFNKILVYPSANTLFRSLFKISISTPARTSFWVCSFWLVTLLCATAIAEVEFTETEINAISAHGPWPASIPPDPGNELSGLEWAEKLGKSLFNDSSLSSSGTVSCASCHQADQGFADGLPVAIGEQIAVRNTLGLFNVGLQRWFGWDGGADSLWGASLRPMLAEHEMGGDVPSLAKVLRSDEVFMSTLTSQLEHETPEYKFDLNNDTDLVVLAAKTIGAYTRTLLSGTTPFDDYRNALISNNAQSMANYSDAAKRGLKLFVGEANCHVCHFGANFSNGEFHDIGQPFFTEVGQVDPGRFDGIARVQQDPFSLIGSYAVQVNDNERFTTSNVKRSQMNWGQWRTPSLRNLTLTAPYMHNGSLSTLRDVVDWYSDINPDRLHTDGESLLKPLNMSERDRMDLVAFLESLSIVR